MIGHHDARPHRLCILDPFIEMGFVPHPIGALQRIGIFEPLERAGLAAEDAEQVRPLARRGAGLDRVTGPATLQELARFGSSCARAAAVQAASPAIMLIARIIEPEENRIALSPIPIVSLDRLGRGSKKRVVLGYYAAGGDDDFPTRAKSRRASRCNSLAAAAWPRTSAT